LFGVDFAKEWEVASYPTNEFEMTKPNGVLNTLLADYAAGHLAAPLHGLVAAHLTLKADNRGYVAALESLHGMELDRIDVKPIQRRDEMLESIMKLPAASALKTSTNRDMALPAPIAAFFGDTLTDLAWRSVMPGLKEIKANTKGGAEASLLWIKAGRVMPSHTHEGTEITLVLKGGFTDASGHYSRGDIAVADGAVNHQPRADDHEDCICFVVNDAPLRLTSRIGRFIQHLSGH